MDKLKPFDLTSHGMVFSAQLCPFIAKQQDACYIATSILDGVFFALCCHLCRATGCWTLGKMATGSQFEEIPYLILRCWRFALIHRPSMIFHLVGSMIGKTGNSIMRCWLNSLDGSLVFVYSYLCIFWRKFHITEVLPGFFAWPHFHQLSLRRMFPESNLQTVWN